MPPRAIVRVTIQPIYSTGHGAATNTFPGFSTVSLGSLERWPCEERQCTREITHSRLIQKFCALPKWYYRSCSNPHRRKELVHRRPPSVQFSSVQSLSHVRLFATPWIPACQDSLSITNSWSLPKLMSIEPVMPSSYLIFCHALLLPPPIPPNIRVFSNESTLRMR